MPILVTVITVLGVVAIAGMFYKFGGHARSLVHTLSHLTIRKDPKFALLYCLIPGLYAHQQKFASYLFLLAKRIIAQVLKRPMVPFQGMTNGMAALMLNEQMSSILKDSHARFLKIWEPMLEYSFPSFTWLALGVYD